MAVSPRLQIGALGPEDRFASALLAAFTFGVAAYLALGQRLLQDGDTAWHIQAGLYIFQSRTVPASDPFSYTFAGHAWLAHEWLAEVAMAGAFRIGSWAGVALLSASAAAVTIYLIGREFLKRLPVRWALCLLWLIWLLLHPHALARPHLLAWPLLAVWTLVLMRARERDEDPPLLALPLILIWANVHASYILGLGIAAAFAAEAGLASSRRHLPGWAGFVIAAVALAFITPHGIRGFLYPFQVSGLQLVGKITEWRATTVQDDKLFLICVSLLWLLVAVRRRRIHFARIALLGGMTAMAIIHARHQMPLVIVSSLIAAPLFRRDEIKRRPLPFASWWAVLGAVALLAAQAATHFRLRDNWAFPMAAIAKVPANIRSQPVFNSYAFGGPLILAGVRPYIDGRTDMYGDAFTLAYVAALRGSVATFRELDREWHFGWAILAPDDQLTLILDRSPEWRRLYADRWAIVYVRAERLPNP